MDAQLDSLLPVTSRLQAKPTIGADLGRAFDALPLTRQREVEKFMDEQVGDLSENERKEFLEKWENANKSMKLIILHIYDRNWRGPSEFRFPSVKSCAKALMAYLNGVSFVYVSGVGEQQNLTLQQCEQYVNECIRICTENSKILITHTQWCDKIEFINLES